MLHRDLRNNIWKYYAMQTLAQRIVTPILVIFLLAHALSKTEIGTLLSIGTLGAILLEVPSGLISDMIGHKRALIAAFFLKGFAMLLYILAQTFMGFLFATLMYWAGRALWSGTNSAFLFETLKDTGHVDDYETISGKITFVTKPLNALLLVGIPFLYAYAPWAVFSLNAFLFVVGAAIAATVVQPTFTIHVRKQEGFVGLVTDSKRVIAFLRAHRRYARLMIFIASWRGIQGAIDEFRQVFFQFLRLPTEVFGFLYAFDKVCNGSGAYLSQKAKRFFGQLRSLSFFASVLAIFFFVAAIVRSSIGVILFPLRNFFEGLAVPIYESALHKEITKGDRVTLLSLGNVCQGLVRAGFTFLAGVLFDHWTVPSTFILLGILASILLGLSYRAVKNAFIPQPNISI
jgi:MFS family permease